jgi:hypothetical protein
MIELLVLQAFLHEHSLAIRTGHVFTPNQNLYWLFYSTKPREDFTCAVMIEEDLSFNDVMECYFKPAARAIENMRCL